MPVRLGPKDLSHLHSDTRFHIGLNQHSVARAQRLAFFQCGRGLLRELSFYAALAPRPPKL